MDSEEEEKRMKKLTRAVLALKIWKDKHGQDLIEYALMAGFVAVAAGALMAHIAGSINTGFSKNNSVMGFTAARSKGFCAGGGGRGRGPPRVTGKGGTQSPQRT